MLPNSKIANPEALYVTYCSASKCLVKEGSPEELYDSPRITHFIASCKAKHLNWAILSAKYGLFFPGEVHENYNVTFKTIAYKCRVIENDEPLPNAESKERLSQLIQQIRRHLLQDKTERIFFFYEQPLQRKKCYLSILHAAADSCIIEHSTCHELSNHINNMLVDGTGKIQTFDTL
jgi:hypothetical protein